MDRRGIETGCRVEGFALQARDRAAPQPDTAPGATGISLGQWQRPSPVRPGFRSLDTIYRFRADRTQIQYRAGSDGGGRIACQARPDAAKSHCNVRISAIRKRLNDG